MPRKLKGPSLAELAQPWAVKVGRHPDAVIAMERKERGLEVWLRYHDPVKVKAGVRDARTWMATGLQARAKLGEPLDDAVVREARARASALSLKLTAGEPLHPPVVAPVIDPSVWTLRRGIELALRYDGTGRKTVPLDDEGKPKPGRNERSIETRLATFLRIWDQYEARTGEPAPTFHTFRPDHADYVVRTLAAEYQRADAHGHSVALKMLGDFRAVAEWLRELKHIGESEAKMRKHWQGRLKADWETMVGETVSADRPRHTVVETRALFTALDDPRGRLARSLAMGNRLSRVAPARWSDLRLEVIPRSPFGGFRYVEAEENAWIKPMTEQQRALVEEALSTGYLRLYERARVAGEIDDYPMFPQGGLVAVDGEPHMPPALVPQPSVQHLPYARASVLTVDPRVALALEIGAPLRLGQVLQTRRSQVDLERWTVTGEDGEVRYVGFVDVQGKGKKRSTGAAVNNEIQRALLDAFTGFLAPLEERYQLKLIDDYPLFPGGMLVKGQVNPEGRFTMVPATRDALLGWFKELEEAAGVESVKNRGWYGLRRVIADIAPTKTGNTTVLTMLSGTSAEMLAATYRDQHDQNAKMLASEVASSIRTDGRTGGGPAPMPSAFALDPALAKAAEGYTPAQLRAALEALNSRPSRSNGTAVDPTVDPTKNGPIHEADRAVPRSSNTTT